MAQGKALAEFIQWKHLVISVDRFVIAVIFKLYGGMASNSRFKTTMAHSNFFI